MWFDSWSTVLRIVLVGAASYVTLVVLLRLGGKRILAKLSAFDLVVTVALGSMLASAVLSKDVRFVDVLTGMALLVLAQLVVTLASSRLPGGRSFVNAEPSLVVAHGRLLEEQLSRVRLTRDEVMQAIRSSGHGGLDAVGAVVLEPDGTLSVVARSSLGDGQALATVPRWTPLT